MEFKTGDQIIAVNRSDFLGCSHNSYTITGNYKTGDRKAPYLYEVNCNKCRVVEFLLKKEIALDTPLGRALHE